MKESVVAEIKIVPLGTGTASLSRYVADCYNVIKQAQDISYQLTPMGTVLQGPLARVMELAQELHELPFSRGVDRVLTTINIDDRRDKAITMESKVKAVIEASGGV